MAARLPMFCVIYGQSIAVSAVGVIVRRFAYLVRRGAGR